MKTKTAMNASYLTGGLFAFNGALFASIGILLFIFGDVDSVQGSFDDPKKNFYMLTGMFTVFGLIFFAVGMSLLVVEIRKKLRLKALLDNGYRIYATITETYPDNSITINGHHPNYVVCRYEDPNTLTTEIFQSPSYDMDLSGAIGMTVSIFLDPKDHSVYNMDFDPASIVTKY
ncbi:MAG: hypothetical protein J5570_05970 [Lachnospiraceae bacterium]|nr:hypothetical protein [Lachnospiraceae bacterium]